MPFLGLGADILGGILGSHAANSAANTQAGAQINAGHAVDKATGQGIDAIYSGMGQANSALDQARSGGFNQLDQGLGVANKELDAGKAEANQFSHDVYQQEREGLDPFLAAGKQGITSLASFVGGEGMKDFQWDPANDPGYQFRMNEGAKALQNSASARGGALGGPAAKAMERYAQEYASSEYGKSFDRFRENRGDKFGMLSGLAGFGERANGQAIAAGNNYMDTVNRNDMTTGELKSGYGFDAGRLKSGIEVGTGTQKAHDAMQGSQFLADYGLHGADDAQSYYTGAASSKANGTIGAANAWGNTLQQIGNAGQNFNWGSVFGGNVNLPIDRTISPTP